ncbi:hypothetical protein E4U43_007204 [Claviceps pusilla]|uniref:Uncharacterized protein n=1 Tax=Claviceps pusilla TaxID=123648 RepID=A0A9P7NDE0_9HYPO|nr:hypothetical protein E4U43_007204 [Claviceps pusilla]
MARKLPWDKSPDVKAQASSDSTAASASASASPSRIAHHTCASHSTTDGSRGLAACWNPAASSKGIRLRSPSTSPPPEPPAQEFMTPPDDKYRMVEDELLHTAQKFTTHLHRAEYMRLKELTRARNAHTIRQMERPVVAGLGGGRGQALRARRKREMGVRDGKQRGVMATTQGDVPPWVGTSLQGLMEERQHEGGGLAGRKRDLGIGVGPRGEVRTRAAAGCTFRERGEAAGPTTPRPSGSREMQKRGAGRDGAAPDRNGRNGDDDDDDDDPFGVNRRRVKRIQSREQMRRVDRGRETNTTTRTPDTIPSFL